MSTTSTIRFSCNNCHQTIKAASKHVGRKSRCPSCKKEVVVPNENQVRSFSDEIPLAAMSLGDDVNIEDFDSDVPSSISRRETPASPMDSRPAYRQEESESSESTPISNGKYAALSRISMAFRVLAGMSLIVWVFLIAATLLGLETATASNTNEVSAAVSILSFEFAFRFIGGAVCICGLLGVSELIRLMLEIQENTQLAARRLGRILRS